MKYTSSFTVAILIIITSFAQTDTSKIYNSKHLKKGFYKNYEEYINNDPFIVADFSLIPYTLSKKDSTIIAVEYEFKGSKNQIPNVWGLCDGTSVYLHYPNNDLNRLYYKFEYIGPYPFFTYIERKHLQSFPGLGSIILSRAAGLPVGPFTTGSWLLTVFSDFQAVPSILYVVTSTDKIKGAFNRNYMKKLFASQPDLLTSYEREKDSLNIKKVKEYLVQFNERVK